MSGINNGTLKSRKAMQIVSFIVQNTDRPTARLRRLPDEQLTWQLAMNDNGITCQTELDTLWCHRVNARYFNFLNKRDQKLPRLAEPIYVAI
jgi:hypothetical protein